jgi:hypothetical protein
LLFLLMEKKNRWTFLINTDEKPSKIHL